MSITRRPPWIWAIVPAALIAGSGFVYATATLMKIGIATGVLSMLMGLFGRIAGLVSPPPRESQPGARLPVWALTSLGCIPSSILVGALAILVAQGVAGPPTRASLDQISVSLSSSCSGTSSSTHSDSTRTRGRPAEQVECLIG